jgi:2-polyprenyl-3-methyl-5-hydroxy-6-metoxy-1,4-benzoquinol methylase
MSSGWQRGYPAAMMPALCRLCGSALEHTFIDLGMSPLANAYLRADQLACSEPFYPLHARVCGQCYLVQLAEFESPKNIFANYSYFSSFSDSWLRHASDYARRMIHQLHLNGTNLVVEVGSNDGYLLQYFKAGGISVLGVEPAANVASQAESKGVPTLTKFFTEHTALELASTGQQADLLICNNVLAHVPELNDFVAGLKAILKPGGTISIEVPHLLRLIQNNQFDTIYHEHFSYFSFYTVEKILARHELKVVDVEELPTHGGSLRILASHERDGVKVQSRVAELRKREEKEGLLKLETYRSFADRVREAKRALLEFLVPLRAAGKSIVGYGAPAKASTLLNYCGIGRNFLDYTVDISPHKQHHFLPGTHIPICHPNRIRETRPDYLLILPWNLRDEIVEQRAYIREWGGRFIIPIPRPQVIE